MENKEFAYKGSVLNGFLALLLVIILFAAAIFFFIFPCPPYVDTLK